MLLQRVEELPRLDAVVVSDTPLHPFGTTGAEPAITVVDEKSHIVHPCNK